MTQPARRRFLILFSSSVLVVVAMASGCGSDGLSEAEVRSVCMNLGAGGWQQALSVARKAGFRDDVDAAAAVREVVPGNCPAYADRVEPSP
jgi:hypothetical protein